MAKARKTGKSRRTKSRKQKARQRAGRDVNGNRYGKYVKFVGSWIDSDTHRIVTEHGKYGASRLIRDAIAILPLAMVLSRAFEPYTYADLDNDAEFVTEGFWIDGKEVAVPQHLGGVYDALCEAVERLD